MPSVLIEVRQQYPVAVELEIMEAVHTALRDAFKIMASDRNVRLIVHEAHRFQCPLEIEKPEFYTVITIDAFIGRSLDAKRKLYKEIVYNLGAFGIPDDHVFIMIRELAIENFGIRGGQAACDVNLGFDIKV
ncbi:MAG: tautomerase family protein [Acinetobacter venetianus]|uniref:tautomerase family protein n=2 Tax=Acinetobacter venetianus TaxID=52133 RepID=UPI003C70E312